MVADLQVLMADALAEALERRKDLEVFPERETTGPGLIAAAQEHRPDVVLVSYQLADMEGPAATRAILHRSPESKVVVLAWFWGPPQVHRAYEAGAAGFLPKGITVETLAEAIRRVQAGEAPVYEAELQGLMDRLEARQRRVDTVAARLATLTVREMEVLQLLGAGLSPRETAGRLGITEGTVRNHISRILSKTETASQMEVVARARDRGVLP